MLEFLQKFLKGKKDIVLDVGAGTGRNSQALERFGKVYVLDSSKTAINFCIKRGLKNIRHESIENTTIASRSVKLVTMLDVLEHISEDKALGQINRILEPKGFLLLTVPALPLLWSRWDEILGHKRRYTKNSLKKAVRKKGFKIINISYMYSFLVLPVFLFRYFKSKGMTYESDFKNNQTLVNWFFLWLSDLERKLAIRGLVPFGTSLILVCQKDDEK